MPMWHSEAPCPNLLCSLQQAGYNKGFSISKDGSESEPSLEAQNVFSYIQPLELRLGTALVSFFCHCHPRPPICSSLSGSSQALCPFFTQLFVFQILHAGQREEAGRERMRGIPAIPLKAPAGRVEVRVVLHGHPSAQSNSQLPLSLWGLGEEG